MAKSRVLSVFLFVSLFTLGFTSHAQVAATPAATSAATSTTHGPKTDSAEMCTSLDGMKRAVRGFAGSSSFFIQASRIPGTRSTVMTGYTFVKDAAGASQLNEISFDIFEIMAETFGGVAQPRAQWKAAFEETYRGRVTVYDAAGKVFGTFPMDCSAAVIEFQ